MKVSAEVILKALASDRRLMVLRWLKDPARHFPKQLDGDLVRDGVCGLSIARKLEIRQPTASKHMKLLLDAGLIRSKRIKQWTFSSGGEAEVYRCFVSCARTWQGSKRLAAYATRTACNMCP